MPGERERVSEEGRKGTLYFQWLYSYKLLSSLLSMCAVDYRYNSSSSDPITATHQHSVGFPVTLMAISVHCTQNNSFRLMTVKMAFTRWLTQDCTAMLLLVTPWFVFISLNAVLQEGNCVSAKKTIMQKVVHSQVWGRTPFNPSSWEAEEVQG